MRRRLAAAATALALTGTLLTVGSGTASAETVPGNPHQFYAYCSVDLLGVPLACTETDKQHATHICQYLATGIGIGLDCIQR